MSSGPAPESASSGPEWNYPMSAGNSAILAMLVGNVGADDATAGSLLTGLSDVEGEEEVDVSGAPRAIIVDEATTGDDAVADVDGVPRAQPVAPATTNPGGALNKPFQKHERQVPAARLTLSRGQKDEIRVFQENWIANKARYQAVSAKTGVPAELIAAIHYRESSLDFNTYLHQGDRLGKPAVNVPKDIPIFYEWEKAAVHALNMKKGIRDGLSMTEDTTDEVAMAAYSEAYNGLGYHNRGRTSPYVYAGTDQYKSGMYVADHRFSNVAKDRRLGVLALTRSIDEEGATDVVADGEQDRRSPAQVWQAILAGHILRRGARGREVKALQERLVQAGQATGVDGDFGSGTEKAVKALQKANGLPADGVVGPTTAAAIERGAPNASTSETTPQAAPDAAPEQAARPPAEWAQVLAGRLTLERGASGAVIEHLQRRLSAAGFPVDVDGSFGPGTFRALRSFQKANGLDADGIVGESTAAALG
jgi:lysozyme family protein/peptidoglycan hydrolase-like protein with peptidoglycan-binding domain